MFNFPDIKPRKMISVEQHCIGCGRWFPLSQEAIDQLFKDWKTPGPTEIKTVHCTHCGEDQIVILPGKYDRPGAPKRSCSVQFVKFA